MSHECPECGQVCFCHGDIDDCMFNSEYAYIHCDHCPAEAIYDGDDDDCDCYECNDHKIV